MCGFSHAVLGESWQRSEHGGKPSVPESVGFTSTECSYDWCGPRTCMQEESSTGSEGRDAERDYGRDAAGDLRTTVKNSAITRDMTPFGSPMEGFMHGPVGIGKSQDRWKCSSAVGTSRPSVVCSENRESQLLAESISR